MSWFKVDDKLHAHPKTEKAGHEAMGLWLLAGSYSVDQLTDGLITEERCARLIGDRKTAQRLAQLLVTAGFWIRVEGGYRYHDWCGYQPSAEAMKAERERKRRNVSDYRARRNQQHEEPPTGNSGGPVTGNNGGNASGNSPVNNRVPDPDPDPDPHPSDDRESADLAPQSKPSQDSPQAAPAPVVEPKAPKADRKRPATRQPADGIVADWLHGWGIPQTSDSTWGSEVQKFLDWHASKDSRFVDWKAAWRTWCHKATEFGRGPSAPVPPRGSRPVQRSPEYQPTEERKRAEFIAENARKQRELGLVPDEHGQVF